MFKKYIQAKLERSVKKYFKKHPEVKLIAVVGSVGKTTTKVAIGTVLAERFRIGLNEGNHNSELSAPLAILGIEFPEDIRSIRQWLTVFKAVKKRIQWPSGVDVIIQELGTDGVGQIPHFGTYLNPDITVVTSVAPEHMEFFKTMDAVAAEELSAVAFSKSALINRDDVAGVYAQHITNPNINTYGSTDVAEYRFSSEDQTFENGFTGHFIAPEFPNPVPTTLHVLGEHSTRAAAAAGAIGAKLGLTPDEIAKGMEKIRPVNGRMNMLRGTDNTWILDDSYNASPTAVASALRTLYQMNVPQRIAVLGTMNELGAMSKEAHEYVGQLCDGSHLSYVITVGAEAEAYITKPAQTNGCQVLNAKNAIEAGGLVNKYLEPGGVALFKGSQGGIYLEEGVKVVLHSTEDEVKLVRQSPEWLEKKRAFFSE